MGKTTLLSLITLFALSGCGGGGSGETVFDTLSQDLPPIVTVDTNTTELVEAVDTLESLVSSDVTAGRDLYMDNCAVCHKEDATGDYGPNIVGARAVDIAWALENQGVMRDLRDIIDVPKQELIAAYLQALDDNPDLVEPTVGELKVALGRSLFFDTALSQSRSISCASCHDAGRAFSDGRYLDPDTTNTVHGALSVGDDGVTLGGRNAPTILYAQFAPRFTQMSDGSYSGGMFHDGRALNLKAQAKGPLLDASEMMMSSAAAVVERIMEKSDYVTQMQSLYGAAVFDSVDEAFDAAAEAISLFESTDTFAPFDSKYDRSKLPESDPKHYTMSTIEQQGYELFFDTERTNCSFCHAATPGTESEKETFSSYRFENTGRPKNLEALLERDGDTETTDLGLGGRSDIAAPELYGKMKVPTLRNIAVTAPYMSNGVFKELRTVIGFYDHMAGHDAEGVNPETGVAWGEPEVSATVNHAALAQLRPLSDTDVDALEAFLRLLTDERYEGLLE